MMIPPIATGGRSIYPAISELADIPRWVCWKPEQRNGKLTKVPYCVGGWRMAKSTDPSTWDTFDACWASAFRDGAAAGIGIVVEGSDDLMAADLDHCVFESGEVAPWAKIVVRKLDSYTERSPSGTGLRIFFRSPHDAVDWGTEDGEPKQGRKVKFRGGHLELYCGKRFLTVTGAHLEMTPTTINTVAPEVVAELLGPAKPESTDQNGPDPHPAKEVPDDLRDRLNDAMAEDARLWEIYNGQAPEGADRTRSAFDLKLAGALRRHGGFTVDDFAMLARWWPYGKGADGDPRHWRRTWEKAAPAHERIEPDVAPLDVNELCLSPAEWEARDIDPEDILLGPFSTTTRAELSADTGLGKTMLGLALAHAMAIGSDFLHWKAARPGRTLFIDGEMPQGLIKTRLAVARSWFDIGEPLDRDRLCVLSRADIENMPPLDTPEGARFVLDLFDKLGRFDHVTFDNRACLAIGDLAGEDASTQALKTLQRDITKMSTGQLWLHHTGHDGTRGYGRKAREWELDSVAIGERLENRPELDVGMRLTFSKARRRTPDNRADYEPVEIELRQGQWFWHQADAAKVPVKKLGKNQRIVFDAATKLLAASDAKAPPGHVAGSRTVISLQTLRDETSRSMACDPRHFPSRFNDALNGLTNSHRLGHYDGMVWLVQ